MTMPAASMTVLDLPEDLLFIIFYHLPPKSFLSLVSACTALYAYRTVADYWRPLTSQTFRLPISPLLAADGSRWIWLYKKLKTQTRPFTWGKGIEGGLGRGVSEDDGSKFERTSSSWPTQAYWDPSNGIIADLQCGGWSTSILTTDGDIYMTGILDAADGRREGPAVDDFTKLTTEEGSPVKFRQFSSGRRHILALDDAGRIFSGHSGTSLGESIMPEYRATRVVAGWHLSSAYVPGHGIIHWAPVGQNRVNGTSLATIPWTNESDAHSGERSEPRSGKTPLSQVFTHIVLEHFILLLTTTSQLFAYCTDTQRLEESGFSRKVGLRAGRAGHEHPPFEVPGFTDTKDRSASAIDVQGSFRNFVVFMSDGRVLKGDTAYLERVFDATFSASHVADIIFDTDKPDSQNQIVPLPVIHDTDIINSRPADFPAWQHTGVIQLAFGDYHAHALHADGRITAYGYEPSSCGALGLGSQAQGSRFRGVKNSRTPLNRDGILLPVASLTGRTVWFEKEKRAWLSWLEYSIRRPNGPFQFPEIFNILNDDVEKQAGFSEWVEREGRNWEPSGQMDIGLPSARMQRLNLTENCEPTSIQPYFAIALAAAGWHTGALVIVDDEAAEEKRKTWLITRNEQFADVPQPATSMPGYFPREYRQEQYIWEQQGFPKVVLPDGYEFPGDGPARPWK